MIDNQDSGVERSTWVLILTCWPNDEKGFERPALALFDDREEAEDVCYEYMSNDGLQRDDYTVVRREAVDSLSFPVSFDDVNDRRATEGEQ